MTALTSSPASLSALSPPLAAALGGILDYNTTVVLAGTGLLGLVSGVIGSFAVLRRRALIGDALSHAALPGICIAFLLTGQRHFTALLAGAFVTGLIGVWTVSFLRRHTRTKEDAAIGIVLSVFFGAGIVLSRSIQNMSVEGSKAGLDNFIFGKTAGMLAEDVYATLAVAVLIGIVVVVFYKEFKLVSFDSDFSTVQGWPTLLLDLTLMSLLALTAVVGLPAVGVVLMAALLIVPGAAARFWTDRLGPLLCVSGLFGFLTGIGGTLAGVVASDVWDVHLPAGPVIVLAGAALFTVSMLAAPRRGVLARLAELLRLSRKVAEQNLLRTAYELTEPHLPRRAPFGLADLLKRRSWTEGQARRLVARAVSRGQIETLGQSSSAGNSGGSLGVLGPMVLTAPGLERAAAVVRTHRLWELYLIEEAAIAVDHADRDADMIEHVLPPALVGRLEETLRAAQRLPDTGPGIALGIALGIGLDIGNIPPSPHRLDEVVAPEKSTEKNAEKNSEKGTEDAR